jgi:hypothetical protein
VDRVDDNVVLQAEMSFSIHAWPNTCEVNCLLINAITEVLSTVPLSQGDIICVDGCGKIKANDASRRSATIQKFFCRRLLKLVLEIVTTADSGGDIGGGVGVEITVRYF